MKKYLTFHFKKFVFIASAISVSFSAYAQSPKRNPAETDVTEEKLGEEVKITTASIGNPKNPFRVFQILDVSRKVICYGVRDQITAVGEIRHKGGDSSNAMAGSGAGAGASSSLQCLKY